MGEELVQNEGIKMKIRHYNLCGVACLLGVLLAKYETTPLWHIAIIIFVICVLLFLNRLEAKRESKKEKEEL